MEGEGCSWLHVVTHPAGEVAYPHTGIHLLLMISGKLSHLFLFFLFCKVSIIPKYLLLIFHADDY